MIQNVMERVQNGNYYQLLTSTEIEDFIMQKQDSGLADEQLYTINCLFSSIPSMITGGAGTGKTSVIKTLIECYAKYYGTSYILLTAPTGKASRRLAENLPVRFIKLCGKVRKMIMCIIMHTGRCHTA